MRARRGWPCCPTERRSTGPAVASDACQAAVCAGRGLLRLARARGEPRRAPARGACAACQPFLTVSDAWNDVIGACVQKGVRYIPPVGEAVPKGGCPERTSDTLAQGPAGQVIEEPRGERAAYLVSDAGWTIPDTWHLSVWQADGQSEPPRRRTTSRRPGDIAQLVWQNRFARARSDERLRGSCRRRCPGRSGPLGGELRDKRRNFHSPGPPDCVLLAGSRWGRRRLRRCAAAERERDDHYNGSQTDHTYLTITEEPG